jgi:hypothetical protein
MSWTWCIGMFLPVLLVRDMGVWAWVVFAIPNVVGAAAMGWVLPDADSSRTMVRDHRAACRLFSVVTLCFHGFFFAWIARYISGEAWPILAIALAAMILVAVHSELRATVLALTVSTAVAAYLLLNGQIPLIPSVPPRLDILWVALVCILGFALCPYLDLTFHEARQATSPAEGRVAFALGFGLFFFAMILFSLGYSGWLAQPEHLPILAVGIPLGIHLTTQATLKFVLHGRAASAGLSPSTNGAIVLSVIVSLILGILAVTSTVTYHGLSLFEIGYRCFMGFYGLLFPAYVWIRIFRRGSLAICGLAVVLAMPMYWMGFIERQMIWLLPGVAVVVLGGFLPPKMDARTHS